MAGIYIHIPFCTRKCIYCNFFSSPNLKFKADLIDSLCKEIAIRKNYLGKEKIRTIYFGGGTPSLLQKDDFKQIFQTLQNNFNISDCIECTIEANPDNISAEYISMLRDFPFNRISIGIQSLHDNELRLIRRRHTAQQAKNAVKLSQQGGFENISVDLIYGYPLQTIADFKYDVSNILDMNIQHISAYHLTYEAGTVLYSKLKKGEFSELNEELSLLMYRNLVELLAKHGFIQYEISNFSKQGYESKHNSSYWEGVKYLGIGPSAHSFDGATRSWNIASIPLYIKGISSGCLNMEAENLSDNEKYNELIITSLRTRKGLSLLKVENLFGQKLRNYCLKNAQKYILDSDMEIQNEYLRLTQKGIFISDSIITELLYV